MDSPYCLIINVFLRELHHSPYNRIDKENADEQQIRKYNRGRRGQGG
ncbi:hypothetical protein ETAE_1746 [Edwardsiella piscicida]|uniref:Uncharacterized protein n=2 Tax=Edwardsiella TaxID=635 RepID=A0A0H3DQS5_EDWTF|nr:hypothetical protein ETAE_1746 [Edwardsiella tarda EIB202]ADM41686.1 hypothetical protein ETAF_1578 [Edwardsiella tarda FL6-60]